MLLNRGRAVPLETEQVAHGCARRSLNPGPLPAEWCVIGLPAGTLTLNRQLHIKRPRLVLRGAGSGKTVLRVDKPLKDIPGVPRPHKPWGYYVQEAFIMVTGRYLRDAPLTSVTGGANRGDRKLTVGAPARLPGLLLLCQPDSQASSAHHLCSCSGAPVDLRLTSA